jgi:hypothetical protein
MVRIFPGITIVEGQQTMQMLAIQKGGISYLLSHVAQQHPELNLQIDKEPFRIESRLGTMECLDLPLTCSIPIRKTLRAKDFSYNFYRTNPQPGSLTPADVTAQFGPLLQDLDSQTSGFYLLKSTVQVIEFLLTLFRHYAERQDKPFRRMLVCCHGDKELFVSQLQKSAPPNIRVYKYYTRIPATEHRACIVVATPEQFEEWAIQSNYWDQLVYWAKQRIPAEVAAIFAWRGYSFCFRLAVQEELTASALQNLQQIYLITDFRDTVPIAQASLSQLWQDLNEKALVLMPQSGQREDGHWDTTRRDLAISRLVTLIQQRDLEGLQNCGI